MFYGKHKDKMSEGDSHGIFLVYIGCFMLFLVGLAMVAGGMPYVSGETLDTVYNGTTNITTTNINFNNEYPVQLGGIIIMLIGLGSFLLQTQKEIQKND